MRVFVTGAGGFVGRHLIRHLLDAAPDVEIVGAVRDVRQDGRGGARTPGAEPRLRLVRCDLCRRGGEDLRRLVAAARPDHVYHLAARSSGADADREAVFAVNVEGTRRLMAALAAEAPRPLWAALGGAAPRARCLFASSGYVYGPCDVRRPAQEGDLLRPLGVYAESKREAEGHARGGGALVARAFNHTGPGQTEAFVIPAFARQIAWIERGRQAPQIEVGSLEAQRDFLDVHDVVRAYRVLLSVGERAETYNVCRGEAYPLRAVLSDLLRLSPVPIDVAQSLHRTRPDDLPVSVGDPARLKARAGWEPAVPFSQTLEATLDWWRAQS